ncbi:MAG: phosphoribosylformylglycinamidine synthase subunit PurQ [Chitinophagales bacterium]|nr:phosphoribosylformylglycinamidine synthase subunit PurQ [Chitinophagales bacterium]MDW8427107.1 phosphoribosylformylglycinamidine synthase subunit PurQ [Chitinophagales bacterium]
MKFGVVVFPGSNCDRDLIHVLEDVLQQEVVVLWHKQRELKEFDLTDCIMLPGGFSYGDYLRPGAIARFSPIMPAVVEFAQSGGYVWGICNGFQILCEAGLLPGVLLRNVHQRFVCRTVYLRLEHDESVFTHKLDVSQVLQIPIAHADGRYYADPHTLEEMQRNRQIIFRYCSPEGQVCPEANPNGSLENIAGITNQAGNVLGMMPHPERAAEEILGSTDGRLLFQSFIETVRTAGVDVMDDLLR